MNNKFENISGARNLYEILQVQPNADPAVIKAAYHALQKQYHPDRGGDRNLCSRVNEAAEILLKDRTRNEYDQYLGRDQPGVIGNYRIIEKIGEGGFGTTYKGEHIILKEPVCIKHGHFKSPQYEDILIQEARAIWDLRHYGLPAMRDMLKLDDGSLALVMSYVPGKNLEQVVEKAGSLDPEHVAWITERTLNILWYLHDNSVIHGDVKPQNIIIQPDTHRLVLVDFGLTAVRPQPGQPSKGYTKYFSPPEQKKGLTLLPESDFYSLGMTMAYALGGDIRRRNVPESVPDPLCGFIGKLIRPNVLDRPREAEKLLKELEEVRVRSFGRRRSNMKPIPGL